MNLHEMNTRIKMDKRDTWALQRAALYIQRLLWNKGAQLQVCWCRPATLAFRTDAVRGKPVPQSGMCLKRQQIRTQTLERQWPCHSGTAPQICNPFCVHCRTEQSTLRQWVYNHRRRQLEWQSVCWLSVNSGLFLSWDCLATLHGPSWSRTQYFLS